MCELDIPAMVHVSAACNDCFHTTGSHYLGADTTGFQLVMSNVFKDFPSLKIIIPHGGGAVLTIGDVSGESFKIRDMRLWRVGTQNIYFDTRVYHQRGIDLLLDIVGKKHLVCVRNDGAVRGIDPETGHYFDDTKRYIDNNTKLTADEKQQIFSGNAKQVFSRLNWKLICRRISWFRKSIG